MKFLISILLGVILFICLLLSIAKLSGSLDKETSIYKECINKNGTMVPRTYMCIKTESVIKLENLK